jgi:hypothetical protein
VYLRVIFTSKDFWITSDDDAPRVSSTFGVVVSSLVRVFFGANGVSFGGSISIIWLLATIALAMWFFSGSATWL